MKMRIRPSNLIEIHLHIIIHSFGFRGVLPLGQRARLWEKHRARSRKQQRGHSSAAPQDLQAGQSVTMKNAPMYQPGAVGQYTFFYNYFCT